MRKILSAIILILLVVQPFDLQMHRAFAQLTNIPGGVWLPRQPIGVTSAPAFGTAVTLDAAGESIDCVCQLPASGTMHAIRWRSGTTSTGATMDVGLQTVGADGNPTGVYYNGSAATPFVVANSDDNVPLNTTLTADITATQGDLVAIHIAQPAVSPGVMDVAIMGDEGGTNNRIAPYIATFLSSTWAKNAAASCVATIEYTVAGTPTYYYIQGHYPAVSGVTTQTFSTATNRRGLRFSVPVPTRLAGFAVWWGNNATGQAATFELFNTDAATVMQTVTVDTDQMSFIGQGISYYAFATPQALTANGVYRLTMHPDGNNKSLYRYDVPTNAVLGSFAGPNFYWTSSTANPPTGSGDWTDVTTSVPTIYLYFDQLSAGSSPPATGGHGRLMMLGVGQ